jgi:parallel beta-helix repeat protein
VKRKAILAVVLSAIIVGMFAVGFNKSVEADGQIYIRPDGSIDPAGANIARNGDVYTFTDNIYGSIGIEKDNVLVDGAGYALEQTTSEIGISLSKRSNVTIKNMNIKAFFEGIYLSNSSNNIVSGNNITENYYGITLFEASNNIVARNSFAGNNCSISMHGDKHASSNNTVCENNIRESKWGIDLYPRSDNNIVCENNLTENSVHGIFLWNSSGNSLVANNIIGGYSGIMLSLSDNNLVLDNSVRDNSYGIYLGYGAYPESSYNIISGNNITHGYYGVAIQNFSNCNKIYGNKIADSQIGIKIANASANLVYRNDFMENTYQAYIDPASPSANVWDYDEEGNYWSDYNGTDADGDGIGDIAYVIDENNQDNYPFMEPWSIAPTLPVHNIDSGLDYATIQEAIDAPQTMDGHTLLVDANTYYEAIIVDKSLIIVGKDRDATIIDGFGSLTVMLVTADHVSISNFTVQNSLNNIVAVGYIAYGRPAGGIGLDNCVGCTIANNTITFCGVGIAMCNASGNNVVTNNRISSRVLLGIADANPLQPVGGNNNITFNYISGVGGGILLANTMNDEILENRLVSGTTGIDVESSNHNLVIQNMVKHFHYAMRIANSSDNVVYHNDFIGNTVQAGIYSESVSVNVWDDGYPSGGNYWSDYAGVDECWGENQDMDDSGDIVGDTPYIMNETNVDRYPLMDRWSYPGDLNRDGRVTILDVSIAGRAFGADPMHPRWDCRADINRNGFVNILDIAAIAKDYGKVRWEFD